LENWAALKRHAASMSREREATSSPDAASPLDGDMRTLHIRCGSDIQEPLRTAGFRGDFYEHNYPYLIGPVSEGPGCLEKRARFIVDTFGITRDPPLKYEEELLGQHLNEQRLLDSGDYDRVVVWSGLSSTAMTSSSWCDCSRTTRRIAVRSGWS
jgi:hypothetical protein